MPKMLNDGAVEYEDGTPATEAQVKFTSLFLYILLALVHMSYSSIPISGSSSSFYLLSFVDGKRCYILNVGCRT